MKRLSNLQILIELSHNFFSVRQICEIYEGQPSKAHQAIYGLYGSWLYIQTYMAIQPLAIQPDIHGYIAVGYIATYTWLYSHVHLAIQPMAIQPCMSGYIAMSHITFPVWLYTPKERQLLEKAYIAMPNWLYSQTYQAIQP